MPTLASQMLRRCVSERKNHAALGVALLLTPACVPWPFDNKEFTGAVEESSSRDGGDSGGALKDAGRTRMSTRSTGLTGERSATAAADGQPDPATKPDGAADGGDSTDDRSVGAAGQGGARSTSAMSVREQSGGAGGSGGSGVGGFVNSPPQPDADDVCAQSMCDPDYPCQRLDAGYTCRGQLVDWSPAYDASVFRGNDHDGTVTDSRNGLAWEQRAPRDYPGCSGQVEGSSDNKACTWDQAKNYCAKLPLAGGGWRLPTVTELETLVDDGNPAPAIDIKSFPETQPRHFWTSSRRVDQPQDQAWFVNFSTGYSNISRMNEMYLVRCVR